MNKKVFLEKLRKKLKILNKNELEDIIEEYEDHINEKVASGKTEEEAVKDFGDFEELVKEILSAYKISEDYEETIKEKNVVADFIDTCVSFVKDFAKNIGSRSANDIVKFVVEFIVLILFIAILKLPVLLVEEVGEWLFERLISPFGDGLAIIWRYMIEIIYFVLAVAGIVNFVKKRYMEVETVEEKKSIKEENIEKNNIKSEAKKNNFKKQRKEGNGSFTKVIITMIKVFLVFVLVPAIFSFLAAFVCIVIGIVLLAQGLPYFGIFLCGLTYISLNYIFIDLCFRFIFNKKLNSKALLVSVISSVALFAVGIGLSFYEVVNTTYVDGVPKEYKKIVKEKREPFSENTKLTCKDLYHGRCSYEIDNTVGDDIVAIVTYYDFNKNFEITDDLEYKRKENEEYSIKEIYDLVIKNLKHRKLYDYGKLHEIDVKIKISSETEEKIKENNKKACEGNGYDVCNCNMYDCEYYDLDDDDDDWYDE